VLDQSFKFVDKKRGLRLDEFVDNSFVDQAEITKLFDSICKKLGVSE
jgi:hypothetical protein